MQLDPREMINALDMLHKHCPLEVVNEVQIAVFAYTAKLEAAISMACESMRDEISGADEDRAHDSMISNWIRILEGTQP